MIRRAELSDIPDIIDRGWEHHIRAGNPGMFDPDAAAAYVRDMIEGAGVVLLSRDGHIGGVLAPVYCAPSCVMAVELFWYARDGQGGKLLSAFEHWAWAAGASRVVMSTVIAHEGERVGRVLSRRGYEPAETSYAKVIV